MFFNAIGSGVSVEQFDCVGYIGYNRMFGRIPSPITEAVYLQFLNVTYNRLCGEIPQGWKLKYRSESFDESVQFAQPLPLWATSAAM
ncbi:hypothetical protein AAC387_Pa03g3971 [Persea americana]